VGGHFCRSRPSGGSQFAERFRDSEALIGHAAHLGDLTEAILAIVSVVHGELLCEPSPELRAMLAGSEVPVLFTLYQSM
jgi:hypothetical protein